MVLCTFNRELGKNGYILPHSEKWLRIRDDVGALHIITVNMQKVTFFLDDLRLPPGFVLTGVKFTEEMRNYLGFSIEIFGVPFDFKSGRLDNAGRVRYFKFTNNAGYPLVFKQMNSLGKNLLNKPSVGNRLYVQLSQSLLEDDFGQSTLPLIDAVPIRTDSPSALGGFGIFHKGVDGYAGFISLRVYGIKYAEYFKNFTSVHTINGRLQLFAQV